MIGIDDLLIAFATAAGKSAGEAIVHELIKGITNNLATKEDLVKAVEEIKDYIHQELTEIEQKAIVVGVDTAIRNVKQYNNSGLRLDLAEQNTQQLLNHTASEILSAIQYNPRYLWTQFVPIARFVAVYSAFWSIKSLQFGEPKELINFAGALSEGAYLLNLCLNKIHEMEDETISDIGVDWRYVPDLTPDPSVTISLKQQELSRAYFKLIRGRYENGVVTVFSEEIDTTGENNNDRVTALIKATYDGHVNRIQKEAVEREVVYKSLGEAIKAINDILQRLQGPVVATYASFVKE